ncbi:hypothetical protein PILCRDRAFT_824873, partial [Piloderma croceum F 1598]
APASKNRRNHTLSLRSSHSERLLYHDPFNRSLAEKKIIRRTTIAITAAVTLHVTPSSSKPFRVPVVLPPTSSTPYSCISSPSTTIERGAGPGPGQATVGLQPCAQPVVDVVQSDNSSEEESGLRPLFQSTRVVLTTPNPLSAIAGQQQWTEDKDDDKEDEEASQPGSTDAQSSSSDGGSPQRKNHKSSHC